MQVSSELLLRSDVWSSRAATVSIDRANLAASAATEGDKSLAQHSQAFGVTAAALCKAMQGNYPTVDSKPDVRHDSWRRDRLSLVVLFGCAIIIGAIVYWAQRPQNVSRLANYAGIESGGIYAGNATTELSSVRMPKYVLVSDPTPNINRPLQGVGGSIFHVVRTNHDNIGFHAALRSQHYRPWQVVRDSFRPLIWKGEVAWQSAVKTLTACVITNLDAWRSPSVFKNGRNQKSFNRSVWRYFALHHGMIVESNECTLNRLAIFSEPIVYEIQQHTKYRYKDGSQGSPKFGLAVANESNDCQKTSISSIQNAAIIFPKLSKHVERWLKH